MSCIYAFAFGFLVGAFGIFFAVAFCLSAGRDTPRPSKRLPNAQVEPPPYTDVIFN